MVKKQIIKLKKEDLDRALIRGLSRAAWQKKSDRSVREKVHLSPKRRPARHPKKFDDLAAEF